MHNIGFTVKVIDGAVREVYFARVDGRVIFGSFEEVLLTIESSELLRLFREDAEDA